MKKTTPAYKPESQLITLEGIQAASYLILNRNGDNDCTILGRAQFFVTLLPSKNESEPKS